MHHEFGCHPLYRDYTNACITLIIVYMLPKWAQVSLYYHLSLIIFIFYFNDFCRHTNLILQFAFQTVESMDIVPESHFYDSVDKLTKLFLDHVCGHLVKECCHKISVSAFIFVIMIVETTSCTILIVVDKLENRNELNALVLSEGQITFTEWTFHNSRNR